MKKNYQQPHVFVTEVSQEMTILKMSVSKDDDDIITGMSGDSDPNPWDFSHSHDIL